MENGQYNQQWHRVHLLPGKTAQAAEDVGGRAVLPAHSGKFALACHTWDAPYRALSAASQGRRDRLLTPEIGKPFALTKQTPLLPVVGKYDITRREPSFIGRLPSCRGAENTLK